MTNPEHRNNDLIIKLPKLNLTNLNYKKQNIRILTPLFGTILFACLYIVATFYYPGGSQADIHAKGFSWKNSYWCNLLNEKALNGEPNAARPIAMTAMGILCLSLAVFWYIFPKKASFKKTGRIIIQLSGILSMAIGMFIFTGFHDSVVNLAGFFGLTATIGTFIGLYRLHLRKLFWLGIFNGLLFI